MTEPEYFTYQWNSYNLHVACIKCGDRIVFQTANGNPQCSDCGNVSKYSWKDVLDFAELDDLKKRKGFNKQMMGQMNVSVTSEPVSKISCYHCEKEIKWDKDTLLENPECPECKQVLEMEKIPGTEEFILYRYKKSPSQPQGLSMIAVKCVSCGAPLEADPTKANFHCKFCGTDNILPLSMRYKVVLDDIYIGVKKKRFPKHLAFSKNGEAVRMAIKENNIKDFTDEELNQVLLENKNNNQLFNLIVNEKKYRPSTEVLQQIFDTTTNQQLIQITGNQLNKTTEEKDARTLQVNPNYKKNIESLKKQEKKKAKNNNLMPTIVLVVVAIIVVIVLISLFAVPG